MRLRLSCTCVCRTFETSHDDSQLYFFIRVKFYGFKKYRYIIYAIDIYMYVYFSVETALREKARIDRRGVVGYADADVRLKWRSIASSGSSVSDERVIAEGLALCVLIVRDDHREWHSQGGARSRSRTVFPHASTYPLSLSPPRLSVFSTLPLLPRCIPSLIFSLV